LSESKWKKMNYAQRKYFLVKKHGFSSKYIDYPYSDLTLRQQKLLKEHKIRKECILKLRWKKIDKKTWENQEKKRKYDFVITQEGKNRFILDIFDAKIKDSDKAHKDSIDYKTLEEAKCEAQNWL